MKTRDSRHVDVFELAKRGEERAGELALFDLPRLAQSQSAQATDERHPLQPLRFRMRGFVDERRRPSAVLTLDAEIDLQCDRCGKPLRWALASETRYFFVQTEDQLARLPVDDAEEEPLVGSAQFDLHGLIEDEAILALPMSPRHADCELEGGLPAAAGLADEEPPERPHPFAALEKLKPRRH